MSSKYPSIGDDRSPIEKVYDTSRGLATTGLSLAPLAVGVGVGYHNVIGSNKPSSLLPFRTGQGGSIHRRVGDSLVAANELKSRARALGRERFKAALMEGGRIEELLGSKKEREIRGFLNTITSILDDTEIVGSGGEVNKEKFKNQIFSILQGQISDIDAEDRAGIQEVVDSILDTNDRKGSQIFNARQTLFGEMSERLAPALKVEGINKAYNPISSSHAQYGTLSNIGTQRFEKIRTMIGRDSSVSLSQIAIQESSFGGGKGVGHYAKITQRGRDPMLIALDLSGIRRDTGASIVRTRAGVVTHAAPALFFNAGELSQIAGGPISQETIGASLDSNKSLARTYEAFAFDVFQKEVASSGGINRLDSNKYFGQLEQFTNQIYTPGDSPEAKSRLTRRAQMFSSQAKIMGMEQITKQERQLLMTKLALNSSELFDPFANIAETERTLKNSLFSTVGLNTLTSGSYDGINPKGVTSLWQLPMVNRIIDPLNARIQQKYNNLGSFVGGNQALFLMDFNGDTLKRLGFGEGQGYVGNQKAVREDLVKSVMSGFELRRDNPVFLNELIQRKLDSMSSNNIATNNAQISVSPGQKITLRTMDARKDFVRALRKGGGVDKNVLSVLKETGAFTFSGSADAYKNQVDMFFQAFGGTKAGRGIELGILDEKIVTIPKFTGLQAFDFGIKHVSDVGGRTKLHMSGHTDVATNIQKLFSLFGKLTGRPMTQESFDETVKRMGLSAKELSNIGINFADQTTIITGSDLIKKSPYNANMQLVSSFLRFKGKASGKAEASIFNQFRNQLESNLKSSGFGGIDINTATKRSVQGAYTKQVIKTIAQQSEGLGPQELGRIFGGLWAQEEFYGFEKKQGQAFLEEEFGRQNKLLGPTALNEIKLGIAAGVDEIAAGPRSSMNRRNPGSINARTYNYLAHKLSTAGFQNDQISKFLFSILSRREDIQEKISTTNQYRTMMESMSGSIGPMKGLELSGLERVPVQDFITEAGASKEQAFKFLGQEKFNRGFILDFDLTNAVTEQEQQQIRRVKAAIGAGTKASRGMYVAAGVDFMEEIGRTGTDIEATEGKKRILPEYIRKMNQFANDLAIVQSTLSTSTEEVIKAQESVKVFRKNIGDLFAQSMQGVVKGELRGSGYVQTSFMQFKPDGTVTMPSRKDALGRIVRESTDLTAQQHSAMSKILSNTPTARMASVAFLDTEAFFSSFSTFEEGAKKEFREAELLKLAGKELTDDEVELARQRIGESASQKARGEASQKMRRFFLGTHQAELDIGKGFRGIETIMKRDPDLGPGHIQIGSMYRNLEDVKYGAKGEVIKDLYFERYLLTETGQKQMRNLKYQVGVKSIESFQDIAKLKILEAGKVIEFSEEVFDEKESKYKTSQKRVTRESQTKAINEFFEGMVRQKHYISTGEGGGRSIFPNLHIKVHYEGGSPTRSYDASIAQGMIADADGDTTQLLHPTRAGMTALRESNPAAFNKLLADDLVLRHQTGLFMSMSKEGMANLSDAINQGKQLSASDYITQAILKEHQGKDIGRLDVSIGAMRQGIVATAPSKREAIVANQVLSMFVGFQEGGNIKSKHLPRATDLANHMNRVLQGLLRSSGESIDEFEKLLKSTVLRGVDFDTKIVDVEVSGLPDERLGKLFQQELIGEKYTMQSALNTLQQAARYAGDSNLIETETTGRMANAAAGMVSADQTSNFNRMIAASSVGQISEGSSFDIDRKVREAQSWLSDSKKLVSRAERGMAGPLALGAVGAMAVSALMGYKGFEAEPLLMPGEITDPGVGNAIRNGSIYDKMGSGPSSEMLIERNRSDMTNRPIMDSETRVELNNSFSIKGEALSYGHANNMSQFISSIGGRSSIIVNDTRMPITRNYVNRIMDE